MFIAPVVPKSTQAPLGAQCARANIALLKELAGLEIHDSINIAPLAGL